MIKKATPATAPKVTASVEGRIMYSEPRTEVILLNIQPGEEIPLHKNPLDVLFAGIEGKAKLLTPATTETIEAGETIFVTAEEERAWSNTESTPAKVLVIKILL